MLNAQFTQAVGCLLSLGDLFKIERENRQQAFCLACHVRFGLNLHFFGPGYSRGEVGVAVWVSVNGNEKRHMQIESIKYY